MAINIEEIKKLQEEALKKLPEQIASKTVKSPDEDEVLRNYKLALDDLRKDGVNKILSLHDNTITDDFDFGKFFLTKVAQKINGKG